MRKLFLAIALLASCGCGYNVVGHTNNAIIPKEVQSIGVPTFKNETSRFKVEQQVTAAVVRELMTRTHYKVRAAEDPGDTDAELKGTITAYWSNPVVFDPVSGRATTAQLTVSVKVALIDRKTKKALYENGNFVFREHYEISGQTSTYFDESSAAVQRLSKDLAASLVTSILTGF
jgi:hypothetical protein